jgi:hypothetical protein
MGSFGDLGKNGPLNQIRCHSDPKRHFLWRNRVIRSMRRQIRPTRLTYACDGEDKKEKKTKMLHLHHIGETKPLHGMIAMNLSCHQVTRT